MFSKQDYLSYFEQIASLERMMIYRTKDMVPSIDEELIRKPLGTMADDETRHYSYIINLFNSLFLDEEKEKRKFKREHFLGTVKMKINDRDDLIEGYCVNISEGGICLEYDYALSDEDSIEVWVEFFDGQASQHHKGKLVWSVKLPKDKQIGRITTKSGMQFS